jgi:uncharacterized LabA/DUF88 family protein
MDTVVYIDGYNLFYGRLRNSPYKWLDIVKLFDHIIKIQTPSSTLVKVKYFTAPVKANFASHGRDAVTAQNNYHRALQTLYPELLEIINGYHTVEKGSPPRYSKPIDKDDRVDVWKFEEKQTDVNIALAMYKDALTPSIQHQVLVSSDSDLEPALKLIKADMPSIQQGIIFPRRKPVQGSKGRSVNQSLSQYADWNRSYILDSECQLAQLKEIVPTQKKAISKPEYW